MKKNKKLHQYVLVCLLLSSYISGITDLERPIQIDGKTTNANEALSPLKLSSITQQSLPLELQKKNVFNDTASFNALSEIETKKNPEESEEKIECNLENTDLQTFKTFIEEHFSVTFITDDIIQPLPQGGNTLQGHKISFKTNKLLSKKEIWDLFVTFLNTAKFAIVPDAKPHCFRIKSIDTAKRSPLITYIGIDPASLPSNDEIIRYVYFIENRGIDDIKDIIDRLRSDQSDFVILSNHKAFVLTDKAYNIKTLMHIVKELDKISMPQSMSVLKLRRADAQQVKDLYSSLIQSDSPTSSQQFFQARKQPTSLFFPENTTIIAEPRTNSLILLGTKDAIAKIENFIVKNIDVELDAPYSPFYIYQLKYADAKTIAEIMTNATKFGERTVAGQNGGVRGNDKYMKPITFVPEEITNRLIIKGHYDDYLAAKEVIKKLDQAQPQIALEVLILSVGIKDQKQLGAQIRSKEGKTDLLGTNVKFQTSGLYQTSSIVPNTTQDSLGVTRLLGDLVSLAQGAAAGNTLITLGSDFFGVTGLLQALSIVTDTEVISHPFIVTTNKTPANITVGESRRVQTGTILSGANSVPTLDELKADLSIDVTPQINADGRILLNLNIQITNFTDPSVASSSATTNTRNIKTNVIVADNQVLALGGLIKNSIGTQTSKVPLFADIPILGWLFKNKNKQQEKDNLLVLIVTRKIDPFNEKEINALNDERIKEYRKGLASMEDPITARDPIERNFFSSRKNTTEHIINDFLFARADLAASRNIARPKTLAQRRKMRKQNRLNKKMPKNEVLPTPDNIIMAQAEPPSPQISNSPPLELAMHNKKRTKLSLSDFFNGGKTKT